MIATAENTDNIIKLLSQIENSFGIMSKQIGITNMRKKQTVQSRLAKYSTRQT